MDNIDYSALFEMNFTKDANQIMVPSTIADDKAQTALIRAVEYVVHKKIPGDFVECGVYEGASVKVMIRAGANRPIWLYDTFSGMPKPGPEDTEGPSYDPSPMECWEQWRGWMSAHINIVRCNLDPLYDDLHYVEGMVEDTIPDNAPQEISLLHLDTDFYSSTKHELEHLFPRLAKGGVLIIDDYGAFSGCKKAVDDYNPGVLHFINKHVRMVIKEEAVR